MPFRKREVRLSRTLIPFVFVTPTRRAFMARCMSTTNIWVFPNRSTSVTLMLVERRIHFLNTILKVHGQVPFPREQLPRIFNGQSSHVLYPLLALVIFQGTLVLPCSLLGFVVL